MGETALGACGRGVVMIILKYAPCFPYRTGGFERVEIMGEAVVVRGAVWGDVGV